VQELQLLCGDLPFDYMYDIMRRSFYSRMMGRNKYLDRLFALNNTFKNYIMDKYLPVSLSNHSVKSALLLYFEHLLCFDVWYFSTSFLLSLHSVVSKDIDWLIMLYIDTLKNSLFIMWYMFC